MQPRGDWRQQMRSAIRDPAELCRRLRLPPELAAPAGAGHRQFRTLVPEAFVDRMRVGDPEDPLLLQVLPAAAEAAPGPETCADPLHEAAATVVPGLLQKYQGRALLITAGACAVHCRYCFRRHFPYQEHALGPAWWRPAVAAVAADPDISELLFSGGDPWLLPNDRLEAIVADFAALPQLRRLRFHTRLPVVLPDRVDAGLLRLLERLHKPQRQVIVVIHANHAAELDANVGAACARLRQLGIWVLNQTVLLAGINDSLQAQVELAEALAAIGVMPYYLHALDPVSGAGHFAVEDASALALHAEMRARLPGYLLPRLVREVPAATAKTPLAELSAVAIGGA